MQGEQSVDAVLDTIGDERTRTVLAAIAREPGSVKELTERLDLSRTTVYRRVETLQEHELVAERTLVADDGNHYNVYWSDFKGTMVTLDGDGYGVRVIRDDDLDRLTQFLDALSKS